MENDGKKFSVIVEVEDAGARIDKYISELFEDLSRSYIQKLIDEKLVLVNGKVIKANYRICTDDHIEYFIPLPKQADIQPENISLDILYEDADILIVNKPKGMVVHPAAGHYSGTLVNAVMYHCKDKLSGINGVLRPGIVHRIDMDTTGALVICKNDFAHQFISEQLKVHSITRIYNAIVYGGFSDTVGTIDAPIGRHPIDRLKMAVNRQNGKPAVTHYTVLKSTGDFSYIECRLDTGRTHQIRVHMASIKHPLLGDTVYGPSSNRFKTDGQVLHARVLGFIHPTTKEYVEFEAPLPQYFNELLQKLSLTNQ